ncbi:hypothetical protein JCM33374_g2501 [Metschnikowia sp. JCM 33374]|nr:hypothetical protein JCM33374_g2501 [Metschnikowia sp. JCM 33374]
MMAEPKPEPEQEYSAFYKRKILLLSIATLCGSLGPLAANIFLPSIDVFQDVFNTSKQAINGTISMFMFVIAFAPLFLSLWSDIYGRRPLLLSSLIVYLVSNILISALPPSIVALYVFRAFQGIGASNLAVGVGIVADISEPKNRAKSISFYMIGPQLGPVLGPMLGMVGATTFWRLNFIILAIIGFVALLMVFLFLPETLRALVGNGSGSSQEIFVPFSPTSEISEINLPPKQKRPGFMLYLRLCLNKPVIFCALSGGLAFSCFYAVIVSYSEVLTSVYRFTILHVCLAYIAPGVALIAGSILFGVLSDKLRVKSDSKYGIELRFKLQIACLIPFVGTVISFGWVAQSRGHFAYLILTAFFVAFFVSGILITNTTYLSEISRNQPHPMLLLGTSFETLVSRLLLSVLTL